MGVRRPKGIFGNIEFTYCCVRFDNELMIAINGVSNKSVIYKEGFVLANSDDIEIEEIPPSGFF